MRRETLINGAVASVARRVRWQDRGAKAGWTPFERPWRRQRAASRRAAGGIDRCFPRSFPAVLALVLAGLLAACGTSEQTEFTGSRLKNPYQAPDIALTDTDGQPYSLASSTDKALTLVFFGYTHCPDFCPLVLNNIAAALNQLSAADREQVDVVLVTTDPARDDEKAMRAYLDRYNESFIGLTGDLDTITEVGDPLHIYVNDGEKLPTGGRDLGGHSTITLAIDSGDEAVALWNQETSAKELAADLRTLLTED